MGKAHGQKSGCSSSTSSEANIGVQNEKQTSFHNKSANACSSQLQLSSSEANARNCMRANISLEYVHSPNRNKNTHFLAHFTRCKSYPWIPLSLIEWRNHVGLKGVCLILASKYISVNAMYQLPTHPQTHKTNTLNNLAVVIGGHTSTRRRVH